MNKYLWFNPERFLDLKEAQDADGMKIIVALSPYETPKGVEGAYDIDKGSLTIDFKYIDKEPAAVPKQYQGVTILEGRYTGKLLSIVVPVDNPPFDKTCFVELQTKLISALEKQSETVGDRVGRQLNLDAARSVINQDLEELISVN